MTLYVAAFACLTRWRKVDLARRTKPKSLDNEVTKLGRDLDRYMIAVPRVLGRRERNRHRGIYDRMVRIFSERDLTEEISKHEADTIQEAIRTLEAEIQHEFERSSFLGRLFGRGDRAADEVVRERGRAESD